MFETFWRNFRGRIGGLGSRLTATDIPSADALLETRPFAGSRLRVVAGRLGVQCLVSMIVGVATAEETNP